MMTHRTEQMASSITKAVQDVIARGLQDPRISGMITVTGVRVTPDLKIAFITVSVLPEPRQALTLHGLNAAARHIRREAGELIDTRQLPEFRFVLDESTKKQAAVLREIDKVREERERRGESPPEPGSPGPETGWGTTTP